MPFLILSLQIKEMYQRALLAPSSHHSMHSCGTVLMCGAMENAKQNNEGNSKLESHDQSASNKF